MKWPTEEVLAECRQTHTTAVDVLGWEWEMNVNEQAKQRAEAVGVELRLYQIPNDVMDRRAKAEDVHFYSLAYIEAQAKMAASWWARSSDSPSKWSALTRSRV